MTIETIIQRAQREVDDGVLPGCQLALACNNEIVCFAALGDAKSTTRYTTFSSTKAIFAGAMRLLFGDGALEPSAWVVDFLPGFGTNGKDVITVEQLMIMTAGIPHAPLDFMTASTKAGRLERYAKWRLNWEPGTASEYHPTSAHWVLADVLETVTGTDYRTFLERRVIEPLGLETLRLGVPEDSQSDIADLELVGDPAPSHEIEAVLGVSAVDRGEATPENMLQFNRPDVRSLGVPGGGVVSTAADVALFFQALLHNPGDLWEPAILADATSNVRNNEHDRLMGWPAGCSLGLQIAGDDGHSAGRGFGATVSPRAFGWAGAGGQLAWADPATGISFAYLTNGIDLNVLRQGRRGVALSSRAAVINFPVSHG